ncbi:fasciclin domain-containing protein [Dysgonomonas sp. GY75]|uniref:fasciclin domain-containing protein n=1 Tax=Dysgonomonas sp. GY75 TaxID=2780419 RepID=UPI00188325F1|nr:fasciclin domain-containing protein [Dysgonomonas sp. GY75]MBF0648218.1 fasciclin domain-containing protein [Dysgonomonas sp. GY75]
MKNRIKIWYLVIVTITIPILLNNCTDDSYLIDGGTANPYYDGTMMEFLKSKSPESDPKNDYFSDLVEIIELADMEEVFEKKDITFFAPTNWSIRRTVNLLSAYQYRVGKDSIKSLKQIKPEVWKEHLSMYILKEKYLLKDIPQIDTTAIAAYPGQTYITYGGLPMNAGVVYGDANGVKYAGARQILYSYIYDITTSDLLNAYVATCNIQPKNGAVHVIRLTDHYFGFEPLLFVSRAIEEGILPYEE